MPRRRQYLLVPLALAVVAMAVGSWTFAGTASVPPSAASGAAADLLPIGPSSLSWSPAQLAAAPQAAAPYSEEGYSMPGARLTGALPTGSAGSSDVQVLIGLAFSNSTRLATVLAALQDPGSPAYHQYLSASEFDQEFGAPSSVYASLVQYVDSFGATSVVTHPDRLSLGFMIDAAGADALFHTTLAGYVSSSGAPYYAPESAPRIPAPLAPFVVDVEGLSNYSQYTNHFAPFVEGPLGGVAQGLHPKGLPPTQSSPNAPPGSAGNPFNATVPTANNPQSLRFDRPVLKNVNGTPSQTCATATCGDFVPLPDLQVTYNLTGVYQTSGYPVNATVASILWSDTVCHAASQACKSGGHYNAWCGQQGFGGTSYAWDFYMPDVTSTWAYTLPAGEPAPTAYSLAVSGPSYAYPAGSAGFSASCDSGGAEAENTLDVAALGSLAPGANIFQVFDGTGGTTAGLATAFSDVLSPSVSAFSALGGSDTPAVIAKLQNVSVITNSWGGSAPTGSTLTTWDDDLAIAAARGITVVGATGDSGTSLSFPTEAGGNSYGTIGVGGTTAAIAPSSLLRGPAHLATGGGTPGGTPPYFGVGTGEIGWYAAAGTVAGFSTALGSTEGVANSSTYWRPSWANASSDAVGVADAVRPGNYKFEADVAAIANDTLVDLSSGPYAFNITCAVSTNCTAVSPLAAGTTAGSSPVVGWTYFVGTSISDQVAGAEILVIDHALFVAPGTVCEGYWATVGLCPGESTHQGWLGFADPSIYAMGQLAYAGELSLAPFYDVVLFTGGGGNTTAYRARTGYDLATGWGVLDAGNYTQNVRRYPVTFVETGLPAGSSWSVQLTPMLGDAGCTVVGSACANSANGTSVRTTVSFNATYGRYTYAVPSLPGYVTSSHLGTLAVDGANVTVSIAFVPHTSPVTFRETGLANSTPWSVTLGAALGSSTDTQVVFAEPNGTYNYSVNPVAGYTVSPRSGSLAVGGAPLAVTVTFTPVTYAVTFVETGLSNGTAWTVTVGGSPASSTGASLELSLTNGTYAFSVSPIAGYTVLPATGSVTLNGTARVVNLTYRLVIYGVTFVESGLPGGTPWSVRVGGSNATGASNTVGLTEPNGSYAYSLTPIPGYTVDPSSGTLTVAGGSVVIDVTFARVTYAVSFVESGLLPSTSWTVELGGSPASSNGTQIGFEEPNGSFGFSVTPLSGYTANPHNGSITVSGGNVTIAIDFLRVTYAVRLVESGLPPATNWSAALDGVPAASNGSTIGFFEPNGTFGFAVAPLAGYTAAPASGSVVVDGGNVTLSVTFTLVRYTVSVTESGLAPATSWSVNVAGTPVSGTGATLTVALPNGTYSYSVAPVPGYTVDPRTGTVSVDGANSSVAVAFAPVTFSVSFLESGLATGASWAVTVSANTLAGNSPSLRCFEPNGTFSFAIGPVAGYTASPSTGNLTVAGSNVSVAIAFEPVLYAVTFAAHGAANATNWTVTLAGVSVSGTGSSLAFPEPNGTYAFSVGSASGYTVVPRSGAVTVNGSAVVVNVTFTPVVYPVRFLETGLLAGVAWSVALGGALRTATNTTIDFAETNGSWGYSVDAVAGYTANPSAGTVVVSGSGVNVTVTFARVTYVVGFVESGLPGGTSWSVALNGTSTSGVGVRTEFYEPNGSYAFSVASVPGFVASPQTGTLTVNGSNENLTISFTPVTYAVTFEESGLATSTLWNVTVAGQLGTSNTTTLGFSEPNGSYGYSVGPLAGYTVDPSSGSVTVTGAPLVVNVTFVRVVYGVNFEQSGLAAGTGWTVTLAGHPLSSNGSSVLFTEPNGSYPFVVAAPAGFTVVPALGTANVAGANLSVGVVFTPVSYAVRFVETGLSNGTSWSVGFGGHVASGTGAELSFAATNGTYGYAVTPLAGFTVDPSSGTIAVAGANVSVAVTFTEVTYALSFQESGLAPGVSWSVTVGFDPASGSTSSLRFVEPNGTYGYTVAAVAGYTVSARSGSVVVDGSNVTVPVNFTVVRFTVAFLESGLLASTPWSVTLAGTTVSSLSTTIPFAEPNGSYAYSLGAVGGYTVGPATGSVTVSGANVSVAVTFTPVTYPVVFQPTGLPNGSSWAVTLAGATVRTAGPSIAFSEPNGTFSYSVSAPPGFTANPTGGTLVVNGSSVTKEIAFAPVLYVLTFTESGLTLGAVWSVNLSGLGVLSSSSSRLSFSVPNGSYPFAVASADTRYAAPGGDAVVAGANASVPLVFAPVDFAVLFEESGLPNGTAWSINVSGIGVFTSSNTTLTVLGTNGSYAYRAGSSDLRYAAAPGSFRLNGSSVIVPLAFAAVTYPVTFTESGLSAGTLWSVAVGGGPSGGANTTSITLPLSNGSYDVVALSSDGRYSASTTLVVVAGSAVGVPIAFSLNTWTVTFTETGLPGGALWYVNVTGGGSFDSVSPTVSFVEPNGSYPFTVAVPAGYAATPSAGSFTVAGAAVASNVSVVEVAFTVTFQETGLPPTTGWSVSLAGVGSFASTTATLSVLVPNGTYGYTFSSEPGYTLAAAGGTITVAGAAPPNVTAVYQLVRYGVTFSESGLPARSTWSVVFNGSTTSANASELATASVPNGSYAYTVVALPGYRVAPASGLVVVDGGAVTVNVTFTAVTFNVSFVESGLAPGSPWSVTLAGVLATSATPSIAFAEPNGTFGYSVSPRAGYTVNPLSGLVLVDGFSVAVGIDFVAATDSGLSVTFTETGLVNGTLWSVTLNGSTVTSSNATVTFPVTNGVYAFSAAPPAGYTLATKSGNVTVNGANASVPLRFSIVRYAVTFAVTAGLPLHKSWTAEVNGTVQRTEGSALVFALPNGSYPYLLAGPAGHQVSGPAPAGTLTVAGPQNVTFALVKGPTHPIAFAEHGLPKVNKHVEPWCVALDGWTLCSDTGSVRFTNLTPGSYAYAVVPMVGQTITAKANRVPVDLTGDLTVSLTRGGAAALKYVFPYALSFTETGLPNGTNWSVTVHGVTQTSSAPTIVFSEPNGSYTYRIGAEKGYTSTGLPRPAPVHGSDRNVTITFKHVAVRASPALPSGSLATLGGRLDRATGAAPGAGLWASWGWLGLVGVVAGVRRRR